MEEDPGKTYPASDKMLDKALQELEDGIMRPAPLAAMSPFEPGTWPDKGRRRCLKIRYGFIRVLLVLC